MERTLSIELLALLTLGWGCSPLLTPAPKASVASVVSSPSISSVSPNLAPYFGGETIYVGVTELQTTGAGPRVTVTVGASSAQCLVTGLTSTYLACTTPTLPPGSATLVVTNPDGGASSSFSGLTYLGPAALLGQTSATGVAGAATVNGLTAPGAIATDGIRFAVADTSSHRIMLWNSVPLASGQPADVIVGQATVTGNLANRGGSAGQNTLSSPTGVALHNGTLIVADSGNNRVLIWSSFPTTTGQNADLVIGANDFSTVTGGTSATTLTGPAAVAVSSTGQLFVADNTNARVLYYPSIPTSNNASALFAIGAANLSSVGGGATQTGLSSATGVSVSAGGTFGEFVAVADKINHRVMVYSVPSASGQGAVLVLGQSTFTNNGFSCSGSALKNPQGVFIKNYSLYVADTGNNRVLNWVDLTATTLGQAADNIFGQASPTVCTPNTGGVGQTTLSGPTSVYSDAASFLWVPDAGNNRVTINSWL